MTLDAAPIGGFVSDPDLILHYTFDESNGTRVWDSAVSGNNHATDVPGAQWVADGRFGGAYGPNNPSNVVPQFFPANQDDLNFNPRGDPFTISVWVRSTAPSGYNTIIGKDRAVSPFDTQYRLWMNNTGSNLQGINGNQYGGTLNVSASPMNNGQWHLITMVNYLDGATWRTRVYYDDGTNFTTSNTGIGGVIPGLMRVGDTTRGGNPWNGQLDDLRIYRRALTQMEVATLYNPPPTYADWLRSSLTPAQLALPAFTNQTADPDNDGFNNLLEYALGTHPNNSADIARPTFQRSGDTISFTYPRLRGNIQYLVQYSTDLEGWFSNGIDQDVVNPIGQNATATMTVTPGTDKIFLRLRVMEP